MSALDQWCIVAHLILSLFFFLSLVASFYFTLPLLLGLSLNLESISLVFDNLCMILHLLIFLHLQLLLSQLLLSLDLFDDGHLLTILNTQLLKIGMHLSADTVLLRSLEVSLQLRTLLFNLLLNHLYGAIAQVLLLSLPVSHQSFFLLLEPAFVIEEAIQLIEICAAHTALHPKLKLQPVHVLLASGIALSLVLIVDCQEALNLGLAKLQLDFFSAEQNCLDLGRGRVRLLLVG